MASLADSSLFVRIENGLCTYLLLYVDDIIITGSLQSYISDLKATLVVEFQITDLGFLKYFLGLEIHCSCSSFHVNQAKYLKDLLEKTGMVGAKSCNTLISPSCDFYASSIFFLRSFIVSASGWLASVFDVHKT